MSDAISQCNNETGAPSLPEKSPKIMRCELISWHRIEKLCLRLAHLIMDSGFRPDVIVAIGRGGLIPARLICDHLDLLALTSIKIEHYIAGASRQSHAVIRYPLCTDIKDQRVLLVDDVNDSGDTLEVAIDHLRSFGPKEVRTAVMHHKCVTHFAVDFHAQEIVKWRWLIYPWAIQEDVSGFIKRQSPAPASPPEAQRMLKECYGIRISIARLQQIYGFMQSVRPFTR
jgi:hypoxanthine phosphoribosyltransferase